MSQQTTIRKLAELVDKPVEKLLVQLAEAGRSRAILPPVLPLDPENPHRDGRIRTADQGFADPCLTTWLWRQQGLPLVKGTRQFSMTPGCLGV